MALTDKRTKSKLDGLTEKQRKYAIAFAGCGVIKEASEKAGIHVKTGEKYNKNPLVQSYIKELATVNTEVMTALEMQEELTKMILHGTDEVFDFKANKIVEVRTPNKDKIKAIELLAKLTGNMMPENIHYHVSEKPQEVIDLEKKWDTINQKEYYAPSEEDLEEIFGGEDNE